VRGGAGGGGLGLLYVADIVVAADDARFALGYGALGLTADGGNTWFLPRMVGMRRAPNNSSCSTAVSPRREALEYGPGCRAWHLMMPWRPKPPPSPLRSPPARRGPSAPFVAC